MALQNLSAQAKARMMPVIHMTQGPSTTFAPRIGAAWANRPMALDGLFNMGVTGATTDFTGMLDAIGQVGVAVIPAIECDAAAPYLNAVRPLVGRYAPGLAVKATVRYLPKVQAWVAQQNWQPKSGRPHCRCRESRRVGPGPVRRVYSPCPE